MADNTKKEGYVYGEWRKAINAASGIAGSVHSDEAGKKIGMRGGVVAGTVHHDLFAPLLVNLLGQRWFEQGSLSLFFLYALLQDEKVRAVIQIPPKGAKDVQLEAWTESEDGHRVGEGTVSIGNPKAKTHLYTVEIKNGPKEERRIFKELEVGWEMPVINAKVVQEEDGLRFYSSNATVNTPNPIRKLSNCEDAIPWYKGNSPWEGAIVPLSYVYGLMRLTLPPGSRGEGVGFFGANEIRFHNGPVKVGVPYVSKGRVIAAGTTSKTEYYWHDSEMFDKATNKLVASTRHMIRVMKAGSPLYPEIK